MKKKATKAISVFLILLMAFSSLPLSGAGLFALAADEFNEAGDLLPDGENGESSTSTDVTEEKSYEISAGETITIEVAEGKTTYIKFVPQTSGTYIFTSISDTDTYGYLYNENKEELVYNDDGGNNSNFYIIYDLEAYRTYYWGARYFNQDMSGSFSVSLEKNPVDSISFTPAKPIVLTQEIDGYYSNYWITDEETGKETEVFWFFFNTPSIKKKGNVFTVNYNDGRGSVDYTYSYCEDSGCWEFVSDNGTVLDNYSCDLPSQSYDNQLTPGDYVMTVSCMGKECKVPFTIVKNPVDSISFTPAEPIVLTEGVDGQYEEHWVWDDETGAETEVSWFYFHMPSISKEGNVFTVNYNDGRGSVDYKYSYCESIGGWDFVSSDGTVMHDYSYDFPSQSYDNQLTPGDYLMTVSCMGKECKVPFTIVKNPVDSISFTPAEPIVLTQEIDGYYSNYWIEDEETGAETEVSWFYFHTPSINKEGNVFTVNYNDERGSVDYTYSYCENSDCWEFVSDDGTVLDNYSYDLPSQSYDKQLTPGDHGMTVRCMGKECEVPFTIVKNPVDSISFTPAEPIVLTEGVDGYYENHWAYAEETGEEYIDGKWFYYHQPSIYREGNVLTVNYNDERGSVDYKYSYCESIGGWDFVSSDGTVLDNYSYDLPSQSYDNQLTPGDHGMTVRCMGKECEVPFTIVNNPVDSISFTPAEPIVLTEGVDGQYEKHWVWDEETDKNYIDGQWFCYYEPSIYSKGNVLTVNYNDARGSVDYTCSYDDDSDEYTFVSADGIVLDKYIDSIFNQSYENPLTVGDHVMTVRYMGKECELPFTIVENPVDSISFTPAEPFVLTEGVDGYYENHWAWDEETDKNYIDGQWFRYNTPSIYRKGNVLTVNYNDARGSVDYTCSYDKDSSEYIFVGADGTFPDEYINNSFTQSYENPLTVGDHSMTVRFMGKECEVPFTIVKNPVDSISFTPAGPIVLTEGVDGQYEKHWAWDEETGDNYVDGQWFRYHEPEIYGKGNVLTVNYNDERGSVDYTCSYDNGSDEYIFLTADGTVLDEYIGYSFIQSYENPLTVGDHSMTVRYMGRECEVPFTIVNNPVDSISFTPAKPIVLMQEIDGYYEDHWVWDEETDNEYIDGQWFRFYEPSIYKEGNVLTVNYNDERGSVDYTCSYDRDSDEYIFVSADGTVLTEYIYNSVNQSYEKQLTLGDHVMPVRYMGRECEVPFTIVKNPVDSISFTPAKPFVLTEDVDGYYEDHWVCDEETGDEYIDGRWFYYYKPSIYREGNVFTVNYNDERGSVDYTYAYCEDIEGWDFVSTDGTVLGEYITSSFIQSYEKPLTVGDHIMPIRYMGRECAVPFTIVKNPVDSISFTPTEPIVLMEGVDGYYEDHWVCDEETGDEYIDGQWFCYYQPSIYSKGNAFTVNYNDERGSVDYTYAYCEDIECWDFVSADGTVLTENIFNSFNQSYENPLTVGDHVMTVKYMGRECEVPFTIVKNPVSSVSACYKYPLYVGYDCELDTCKEHDEFCSSNEYVNSHNIIYTVRLTDGSVFSGNEKEIFEKFSVYPEYHIILDKTGINEGTVTLSGVSGVFTVNVEETPTQETDLPTCYLNSFSLNFAIEQEVDYQLVLFSDKGHSHSIDVISVPDGLMLDQNGRLTGTVSCPGGWNELEFEIRWDGTYAHEYYSCSIYAHSDSEVAEIPDDAEQIGYDSWVHVDASESSPKWLKFRACDRSFRITSYSDEPNSSSACGMDYEIYTANGLPVRSEGYGDGDGSGAVYNFCIGEYYYIKATCPGRIKLVSPGFVPSWDENSKVSVDKNCSLVETNVEKAFDGDSNTLWNVYKIEAPYHVESKDSFSSDRFAAMLRIASPVDIHLISEATSSHEILNKSEYKYDPNNAEECEKIGASTEQDTIKDKLLPGEKEYRLDTVYYLMPKSGDFDLVQTSFIYVPSGYVLTDDNDVGRVTKGCAHNKTKVKTENEVPATCTNSGSYDEVTYCSVCNAELSRTEKTSPALGHKEEVIAAVPATCTEEGLTEGKHCSVCDTVLKAQEVIPATGHTPVTDKAVAATCTEAGLTEGKKCSVCDAVLKAQEVIPATGHTPVTDKAVAATCTETGLTEGKHCSACGEIMVAQQTVEKKSHSYETTTTKATTTKDGKIVTACTVCSKVSKTTPIYKASSIKLSKTSYTYNGKAQKPTVTVKNSKGTTLENGTDYTVSYASGCKNTGKYAVTVTFKGNYTGTKTLYFNILPSKTSKLTATQTSASIKATWKAVTGADGYKVTLYTSSGKAVKTVYTTKTSAEFTKLSKGTTYKVRVTAYKMIDGKKVSSSVYTQLTTATKPGTPTLKVTAGSKKASLSWNKQTGATGYVVYMSTSKTGKYKKIATVKGNSKVSYTKTGLTKGKTMYFKVAAYKTVDSKTITGSFSAVKSAKIK